MCLEAEEVPRQTDIVATPASCDGRLNTLRRPASAHRGGRIRCAPRTTTAGWASPTTPLSRRCKHSRPSRQPARRYPTPALSRRLEPARCYLTSALSDTRNLSVRSRARARCYDHWRQCRCVGHSARAKARASGAQKMRIAAERARHPQCFPRAPPGACDRTVGCECSECGERLQGRGRVD